MRRRSVSSLVSPGPREPMPRAQPRHGRSVSGQARQQVVQLREFHLQLAFPGARAAREDIEDQLRAVEHLHVQRLFQIALLRGRQLAIENHHVGFVQVDQRLQLFHFAGADLRGRIDLRAAIESGSRPRALPPSRRATPVPPANPRRRIARIRRPTTCAAPRGPSGSGRPGSQLLRRLTKACFSGALRPPERRAQRGCLR